MIPDPIKWFDANPEAAMARRSDDDLIGQEVLSPTDAERERLQREAMRIDATRIVNRTDRRLAWYGAAGAVVLATVIGGFAVWAGKNFGYFETALAGIFAIIAALIIVISAGAAGSKRAG